MRSLHTLPVLVGLFLGSPPVAAQVTATAVATYAEVIYRMGHESQRTPPGADLGPGVHLITSIGEVRFDPLVVDAAAVEFSFLARCIGNSFDVNQADFEAVLTVRSPTPQPVRVEIDSQVSSLGSGSIARASFDVDIDGRIEAGPNSAAVALPRTIGPAGLPIRITVLTASAIQPGSGIAQATVRIVPDTGCTATVTAPACTTPTLDVAEAFGAGIVATADDLLPSAHAALVAGLQPASLPLPLPPGCSLGVQPAAILWLPPTGPRRRHEFALPPSLRPLSIWFQVLQLEPGSRLGASAVVRLDCP